MNWNCKSWKVLLLFVTLVLGACKNPLDGFDLIVAGDVIRNFKTLEVLDSKGNTVRGVSVRLLAGDTEDVYNMDGNKTFNVVGSLLTFGVDPNRQVTESNTVAFQIELSGDDYISTIVPIEITTTSDVIQKVTLVKESDLPETAALVQKTVALSGGTVETATAISTTSGSGSSKPEDVNVNLPAGTQLRDASGVAITGGNVVAKVLAMDPSDPAALALFPGGSYIASNVVGPSGAASAGSFNVGAFTTIDMRVGTTTVAQFSQPISVEMNISPNFQINGSTTAVTPGTQLAIYSVSAYDPTWKFHSNVTVGENNKIIFETDHLTSFAVGEFEQGCTQPAVINFAANWIAAGTSFPFSVDVVSGGKVLSSQLISLNDNVRSLTLKDLPNSGASIVVSNSITGTVVSTTALAGCGAITNVAIPAQVVEDLVTLQLYVRCPNKQNVITVLPTFQLYYRVSGSNNQFKFLGTVTRGFLQTNVLKSDGTLYDFQAIWGDKVKVVNRKALQRTNTGTVGTGSGDIIGEIDGVNNLSILTEECNKL